MKYKIVEATELDVKNIITLKSQLAEQSKYIPYTESRIKEDKHLGSNLNANRTIITLLKSNNYLQGFSEYTFNREYKIGILEMGVMRKFQNQGCGTALMKALLVKLAKLGITHDLHLYVAKDNIAAIKLYAKFGFRDIQSDDVVQFKEYGGLVRMVLSSKDGSYI